MLIAGYAQEVSSKRRDRRNRTHIDHCLTSPFLKKPPRYRLFGPETAKRANPLLLFYNWHTEADDDITVVSRYGGSSIPMVSRYGWQRAATGGARQRENVYFCTRETFQHCVIGGGDISTKVKTVCLSLGYTKLRTAVRRRNHC